MRHARTISVVVLLLSYGAVGARQPAVRAAVPLPVAPDDVAAALALPSADPSMLLLHVVRLVYEGPGENGSEESRGRGAAVRRAMSAPAEKPIATVPLPLDPSIWRETILEQQVPDAALVAAILNDRRAALLYHGLAALDDETLAWLGPDRETLQFLRRHAPIFATFGRSVHVRAGRVLVPGGADAEPLWEALTGVDAARPAAFVQRLFRDDDGRLAFLYDTVAHLDEPRQRFALGLQLPESSRNDRLRALLDAFADPSWHPSERPFSRPLLDASVLLAAVAVNQAGEPTGPMARRIWDRVFRGDELVDAEFSEADEIPRDADPTRVDAAWLASRISRAPYTLGRRRLDTVLFAQRVFRDAADEDPRAIATALRGFTSFATLMLALEHVGLTGPRDFSRAAELAARLESIHDVAQRRVTVTQFQAAVGIVERAARAGAISAVIAKSLTSTLCAIEVSERGYEGRLSRWVSTVFVPVLPAVQDADAPSESAVLAAMAGARPAQKTPLTIEWEGERYQVDPAGTELRRLHRVRERQGGPSLDAALAGMIGGQAALRPRAAALAAERVVAETLASILYAAHLGDPDGEAVKSGNVALRHDLGFAATGTGRSLTAWRLPLEDFSGRGGWRVRGSLLGLENALAHLALRRLDATSMPPEPKLSINERQVVMLTAALLNPIELSDSTRDEIAATLGRGRARIAALAADPAQLDKVARDAGLGEWRRQALAWTVEHDRDRAAAHFSLLEVFWLGGPRPSAAVSLDAWGAAALPAAGCLCLQMPSARAWEELTGRPSTGLLATRGADVALQVADTLASLQLPASLAPAILGFALEDVAERARPAYFDDWAEFGRAAAALPRERLTDYIAALTADGPLVPARITQR